MGNVRLSYTKGVSGAEIIEENNYYPFGLKHEGYNPTQGNPSYQYKYNGVELQQESGMYAMDWRHYMPELGRFSGMDMLSESYDDSTPYHFALNNPISFSDPTGMYTTTQNGYLFTDTAEIAGLQQYFGNGGSMSSLGGFMSGNDAFTLDANIPGITFNGKGNSSNWNLGSNYLSNQFSMYNAILQGLNNWNFQTKAQAMEQSMAGVRSDHGVVMMDSMWDALGIVLANSKPENKYAAMGLGLAAVLITRSPSVAKAEVGIVRAEAQIAKMELAAEKSAITINKHGNLTDGIFTVSKEAMLKHKIDLGIGGKSIFYPTINADEAVLKAAQYAEKNKLWIYNGGTKAKIPVLNSNVGTLGSGRPTNFINVYKNSNNVIHGAPGTPK